VEQKDNPLTLTDLEIGIFLGLVIGEGHLGGDGRQPQLTIRMHTDHETLFRWLERKFPGARLYGPYHHGGRHYFQWMARGVYLREVLVPIFERHLGPDLDERTHLRYLEMKRRYGIGGGDS
jgi:hypothetical protein